MRRRALLLLFLAMVVGAAWLHDRARPAPALPAPAAPPPATGLGGPFTVRIDAPAGHDLRVVRDRQKILDGVVPSDQVLEISAREWVLVRVADGAGLEISWRRGGGDWVQAEAPPGPWEMTLIKSGNTITVYLAGGADS